MERLRHIAATCIRADSFVVWLGWTLLGIVIAVILVVGSTFELYIAGLVVIYAISALGLDWIQGRAGQISIGNAAFMAIGAYLTARLAEEGQSFEVSLLASGVAGALIGLVIGLPALRLTGIYLAFSTLALQFIVAAAAVGYETMTNNSAGYLVPTATIGPLKLTTGRSFFAMLAVALIVVIVILRNIYRRAPGRAWLAVKESQVSAAVMGLDPRQWKLSAFVWSSALISISGSLLAYYTGLVTSGTFTLAFAISFVAMIIIGGEGSIPGVVLGAILVTATPYGFSALASALPPDMPLASWLSNNVYFINVGLYGILLLAFLLYWPRGIAGMMQVLGHWLRALVEPAATPQVAADGHQRAHADPAGIAVSRVRGGQEEAPPVLDVMNLRVTYRNGACAVDGVSLRVYPGEIVAILGRNGVGKTSTVRAISGFLPGESVRVTGDIRLDGEKIRGMSPIATSKRGLILVPERGKVFPNLTVAEHMRMGRTMSSEATVAAVTELFPVLRSRASSPAGLLSGGERQMLALALAWCLQPRLLVIDELSLGLAPAVTKRLIEAVRELQSHAGVPVLLVEQSVAAALEVADWAYVIDAGKVVRSGSASGMTQEIMRGSSLIGGR